MVGSCHSNPFACVMAGVAALWGSAHGGANEKVVQMLEQINQTKNIQYYIDKAKNKKDPFKLMGFGHRVYKKLRSSRQDT